MTSYWRCCNQSACVTCLSSDSFLSPHWPALSALLSHIFLSFLRKNVALPIVQCKAGRVCLRAELNLHCRFIVFYVELVSSRFGELWASKLHLEFIEESEKMCRSGSAFVRINTNFKMEWKVQLNIYGLDCFTAHQKFCFKILLICNWCFQENLSCRQQQ